MPHYKNSGLSLSQILKQMIYPSDFVATARLPIDACDIDAIEVDEHELMN